MIDGIKLQSGEAELAFAVIIQAWKDACLPTNGYHSVKARNFLCGYPDVWKDSLFFWTSVCNMNMEYLMRVSRERWKPHLLKRGRNCNK